MSAFPASSKAVRRTLLSAALACLLLAISPAHFARAQAETPPPAPPEFDAKVAELQAKYHDALARLDSAAIAEYQALQTRYGESGNLDAAIWAANRISRLKGEPTLPGGNPDAAPLSDPVEVKREASRARFGEIYVAEIGKLYAAEVARLEEETRRLTIAGDLDNAQATANSARKLAARTPKAPPGSTRRPASEPRDGDAPSERLHRRVPEEVAGQAFTFLGRSYYLLPDPLTYAEAVEACEKLGGRLLRLDSEERYEFFHRFSTENGKPLWTDLNDDVEDLDWRHSDGRRATFFRWQPGEPNGGDSQKHVMIGYQGSWDMRDVNDDDRYHAICRW